MLLARLWDWKERRPGSRFDVQMVLVDLIRYSLNFELFVVLIFSRRIAFITYIVYLLGA